MSFVKRSLAYRFVAVLISVLFIGLLLVATHAARAAGNLVLHLPLDEASGATTFADVSGDNHPGACSGDSCPTLGVTGVLTGAAQFDGANDVITVTTAPTPTTFSLSLWFKWDDINTNTIGFLTGKSVANMELHAGGIGVNGLRFIPAGSSTIVDAASVITPGWNHVVALYDGGTATLYVNGKRAAYRTGLSGGNNLSLDTAPLNLGRRGDGSYPFHGALDDVRLYDRLLSMSEIAGLFGSTPPEITLSPAGLDFGTQDITAGPTPSQTVTILNDGLGDLHISGFTTSGDVSAFRLSNSGPITITPGVTRTIELDFDPDSVGTKTMTLTITSDDADEGSSPIVVIGRGGRPNFTVTTAADTNDGDCTTTCSLREALTMASTGGVVDFDPALAGQTITLTLGQLVINRSLTLTADNLDLPVTISGNHAGRVFDVAGSPVTLTNLRLVDGNEWNGGGLMIESGAAVTLTHSAVLGCTGVNGGGVYNAGTLTVQDSTFSGNSGSSGGGINSYGIVTVQNSTFSGNSAIQGGGIHSEGQLTIQNSTFSGNSANDSGGGIYSMGTLTVQNSTFSGNSANYEGSGIRNFVGLLYLYNTLIANSVAGGDCSNSGWFAANDHNLIEDGSCSPYLSGDPNLGPLADNGGRTWTAALQFPSPAIDAGNPATCLPADQRDFRRDGTCDIGAYELSGRPLHILVDDDYTAGSSSWNVSRFNSIQSGLDAALTGGDVTVYSGVYSEAVTLNKDAHVSLAGAVTLNGNLTLLQGDFNVDIRAFTLSGDLRANSGLFIAGNGTVVMAGHALQTIDSMGMLVFNHLTIANTSGLTPAVKLKTDAAVNGTLTMQSGTLGVYAEIFMLNGPVNYTGGGMAQQLPTTLYAQPTPGQNVAPGQYGHLAFNDQSKILPPAQVAIQGDFDPGTSGGHTIAGSTVAFDGAGVQTIAHDIALNNVTVGNGVTLTTAANVTVTGVLSNTGWTQESRAIVSPGLLMFGLANIALDVDMLGSLANVQVVRRDQDHPAATGPLQTGVYWTLTPNVGSNGTFSATLHLPHHNLIDPQVCKYPGGLGGAGWDCGRVDFDSATVWRGPISALSDWAVGNLAGPTAVRVADLRAAPEPIELVWPIGLAMLLISGMSGLLIRHRRLHRLIDANH